MAALEKLTARIAFSQLRGMNPTLAREILSRIGSEEEFFAATASQLGALTSTRSRIFDRDYRDSLIERARRERDFIAANNIRPLYFTDEDYPHRLDDVTDAPIMLYALGQADLNRGHVIGIVGTRHATPYGIDFVNRLVADTAAALSEPIIVVSGLAFGIDAAAHNAALRNNTATAGILAHGLNMIYPAQHRQLAADMVRSGGMLVTEYTSDAPVHKGNFLARNRIVAGLCDVLIVAESARKGGAMVTARLAYDYNREVFALPGRTSDKYSQGCNHLISSHVATLVSDAAGLIDAMGWRVRESASTQRQLFPTLSPEELTVTECIARKGEATLPEITMALNSPVAKVMALLIDMEFKNLILTYPGGKYRLA